MTVIDGRQEYDEGDLVRVIGMNSVDERGGYSWVKKKENAVGHIFEISDVSTGHDDFLDRRIRCYTLAPSCLDGTDPPNNHGHEYHWVSEWLEPVSDDYCQTISDEDFNTLF